MVEGRKKEYVSKDKLYLIAKKIEELRLKITDPEQRRTLRHQKKVLNSLLHCEGDHYLERLEQRIRKREEEVL